MNESLIKLMGEIEIGVKKTLFEKIKCFNLLRDNFFKPVLNTI